MNETINIFSVADDNFAPYCGIMLTSVFENNKKHSFNVFILANKLFKKKNADKYRKLEKKYGHKIEFVIVDDSLIKKHINQEGSRWVIATYYKLLVGSLPDSIHKLLYLDGDIIVTGDLSKLWNTDIDNYALAAVPNVRFEDCPKRFQYPIEAGCFNGGVLLFNLDYWRKYDIGQRCLLFLEENRDRIETEDQDVMNAVLWDKKLFLPITYNYQIMYLLEDFFNSQSTERQKEILETYDSPCIIHYAYFIKPWSLKYLTMPFYKEWKLYKRKSPWSGMLPTLPKKKAINWLIKLLILIPLGIIKYDTGFIQVKKK